MPGSKRRRPNSRRWPALDVVDMLRREAERSAAARVLADPPPNAAPLADAPE